jgi:multisubunit Na+/H+ antiporter MnhG subunit
MAESKTSKTLWDKFTDFMGGTVLKTITEIHMLMPDSILFGSILMFFLTQNLPFGIFAFFIFETVLSHKLIGWVLSQASGPSRSSDNIHCRAGYKVPRFDVERIFSHDQYPSYAVYSISAIGTYLALATSEFSRTADEMGPEYASMSKVAYTFISLVIAAFIFARWNYCDNNISEILIALFMAVIVGITFFYINKAVFGKESMNFLGLPYLVSKDEDGSPIYVCSKE